MKSITIEEIRSAEVNTYSVKDDSPRGFKTVSAAAINVGDMVIINNAFVLVVDKPAAQPEAEQEAGDFTAPETIENAEARHEESKRELALMENAAKARREAYKNALHGGTKEEKEEARAALENAEAALSEYKIYFAIIEENARAAWLSVNLPKICAVLNKYAGRKIGEKTTAKIRDELTAAIGCRAGLLLARESYNRDNVFINAPYWSEWLELRRHYPNCDFRDADGKLIKLAPSDFTISAEFCANPNAKKREILTAHAALMDARAALESAISAYNMAAGRVFEHANVSEWHKQQNITPAKR